jgi:release factor glutamine methyltransferase
MSPVPDGLQRGVAFRDGVAALKEAGIESPVLDAAVLLGHVTGELPATVLLDRESILKPSEKELYSTLVRKRCGRVAVSRIVGAREFYSRSFHITSAVLDPRPETEILVEQAIRCLEDMDGTLAVLDVGTGSGAIGVTVAAQIPRARVTATDISMAALAVARRNAKCHQVQDRMNFLQADLLDGIKDQGFFQAILSNPPYISRCQFDSLPEEVRRGDPTVSLVSGHGGTEFYPPLAERSLELLGTGGSLMVEVGAGQDSIVAGIFHRAGYEDVQVVNDFAGIGRVVKGKKRNA